MSYKRTVILAAGLIILTANSHAELPRIQSGAMPLNQKILPAFGKPAPKLNLKADLVIQDMGYSNEFCTTSCSDQWKRELGVERISRESCSWQMTVKNIGSANSRTGKVELRYDSLGGPVKLTANIPAIRAGHTTNVVLSFNSSNVTHLYRKLNSSFTAKVDSTNTTAESDERNNTKSVRIR
ncbi:hypothetical protein MNBD_GAMMA26-1176 [hydrothermal vent metagenome]|uniref:CARDB domain-containing protein n=1 Tax=hydrothermal vent metagenome TaxID=652676 RepID=A0A3B1BE96_9ZZZZ